MTHAYYLLAGLCLVGALYKLRDLSRDPGSSSLRGTCSTLALLSLAFVTLAPASRLAIDGWTGAPNSARWLGNSATLAAGCSIQIAMAFIAGDGLAPAQLRRKALTLLAVIGTMGALLLTTGLHDHPDFVHVHGHRGPVVAYLLLYLCYLAATLGDALRLAWSHASKARNAALRAGLRLGGAGSAIGLLYCLYKAFFALSKFWHLPTLGTEGIIGPVLAMTSATFIVAGLTVGSWGAALIERLRYRHAYRRLEPLWRTLTGELPHLVLDPHRGDMRERLYRRVIEIHDARLTLAPYRDPQWEALAHRAAAEAGLSGPSLEAAVNGTLLAAALEARRTGGSTRAVPTLELTRPQSTDLPEEAAWLEAVSRAFFSPLPFPPQPALIVEGDPCPK
ncbi:hypothetical protein EDD29_5729 [Actinocorallia herbida]|uniref:DUF6545 domain-containing protein n=1 Tax=Actinocorallia herbida TaxID=58109 RepID=A0A3N1D3G0_9ACTN|nr:MAB_1171c family putative transporter [Actinocorallia herbida]ROO88073.1 hypothetical protein EDD29_5729 [Actinocorallia herbida]